MQAISFDQMRADIAEILEQPPGSIGSEDNLMDLGLDSLRAMSLLMAWNDKGVALDFAEFAAAPPTLSRWWDIILRT